jgi:hypothetical protein
VPAVPLAADPLRGAGAAPKERAAPGKRSRPAPKPAEAKIFVAPRPPDDPGDAGDAVEDPATGYGRPIKGPA